jgi:hypothetical protein
MSKPMPRVSAGRVSCAAGTAGATSVTGFRIALGDQRHCFQPASPGRLQHIHTRLAA